MCQNLRIAAWGENYESSNEFHSSKLQLKTPSFNFESSAEPGVDENIQMLANFIVEGKKRNSESYPCISDIESPKSG